MTGVQTSESPARKRSSRACMLGADMLMYWTYHLILYRELLLISACQAFGLGNWPDIAEHIGSYRTKEEVEAHYLATYIDSQEFPLPVSSNA